MMFADLDYLVQLEAVDCKNRKWTLLETVLYREDGNVLHSFKSKSSWENIVPDSLAEQKMNYLCRTK